MSSLRKFVNPEIVYGAGALDLSGQYSRLYGARKVLVVTDAGVTVAGWADRVLESLRQAGVISVLFSEVTPNPRATEVMRGAQLYRSAGCDAIVAVGGGSPIDCAKGIGIVCTNRCDILECEGVDRVDTPMPPLICIPTTAGSSADVSQFAIISNESAKVKIAIISKAVVPDIALIDPRTTITMDPCLTACTGMDALTHAIEAYVSTASSRLTDLHALQAIRLVSANLQRAIEYPDDPDARDNMMLASLEAGLAFSNASLGAVHAMAHSLGGLLDLPHGECNALLLEHVIGYNFASAEERYRAIADAMGMDVRGCGADACCAALVDKVRGMRAQAGISSSLGKRGVTPEAISALAANALNDPCMVTNPRNPSRCDIETVYAEAL